MKIVCHFLYGANGSELEVRGHTKSKTYQATFINLTQKISAARFKWKRSLLILMKPLERLLDHMVLLRLAQVCGKRWNKFWAQEVANSLFALLLNAKILTKNAKETLNYLSISTLLRFVSKTPRRHHL